MVKWDFWHGLDFGVNDTWSIAYEWKQKFHISPTANYITLGVITLVCIVLLLWLGIKKRKNKKKI